MSSEANHTKPTGAQFLSKGLYYKEDKAGRTWYYNQGEWVRSCKPISQILKSIRKEKSDRKAVCRTLNLN